MTDRIKVIEYESESVEGGIRLYNPRIHYIEEQVRPYGPAAKSRRQRKPRGRPPDGLKTKAEAAAKLGCSIKTLNAHVASGALRYVNIGRGSKRARMRFTDSDLNAFITNQSQTKEQPCPSTETRARRIGSSTSSGEVIAFTARPSARAAGKRKK